MSQELAKASVTPLEGAAQGQRIDVLFNPTEYNVEYSASFQETAPPGLSNPILQFVNGNAQVLTMDLLFDTYTDGRGANVAERDRVLHRPGGDRRHHPRPAAGEVPLGRLQLRRGGGEGHASGSRCSVPTAPRCAPP